VIWGSATRVKVGQTGVHHPAWRGGRRIGRYVRMHVPDHPRASKSGEVPEHTIIAENALGKYLPVSAEVHHVDKVRTNNANSNLVICQDHVYHELLHCRMRVRESGGNPDTDKICSWCKHPKNKTEFGLLSRAYDGLHPLCNSCKKVENGKRKLRRAKLNGDVFQS